MNQVAVDGLLSLSYAYGEPAISGLIRDKPEDFFVEEILGFDPSGEGEHVFLFIEKTNLNTEQVARQLADYAGVAAQLVSYSGMKDRRAITRQWFSVHLPGRGDIDWRGIESSQLRLLQQHRHLKKLRRGVHRGNRFVLRINTLSGDVDSLAERVALINHNGVPNYFGEQRFGRNGDNIRQAERWFAGSFKPRRHQQGLYLSAARAHLFNAVLTRRVDQGNWCDAVDGELLMLAGSQSIFAFDVSQQVSVAERLKRVDLHPTGPLYGRAGKLTPTAQAQILESEVLADFPELTAGLERQGAHSDRRALRMLPEHLEYSVIMGCECGPSAELSFSLPRGCFATAVVRELLRHRVASSHGV